MQTILPIIIIAAVIIAMFVYLTLRSNKSGKKIAAAKKAKAEKEKKEKEAKEGKPAEKAPEKTESKKEEKAPEKTETPPENKTENIKPEASIETKPATETTKDAKTIFGTGGAYGTITKEVEEPKPYINPYMQNAQPRQKPKQIIKPSDYAVGSIDDILNKRIRKFFDGVDPVDAWEPYNGDINKTKNQKTNEIDGKKTMFDWDKKDTSFKSEFDNLSRRMKAVVHADLLKTKYKKNHQ